ncbi:hypothetical protein ACTFIR_005966 [Dictyostelium discoideum]
MNNIKSFFGKKKKTQDQAEPLVIGDDSEKRTVILPPPSPNAVVKRKNKNEKPYSIDLNGVGEVGGKVYNNVVGVFADGNDTGEISPTIYCVSDFQGLLKNDRKWIQYSELPEGYTVFYFQTILCVLNFLRRREFVHYIYVDKFEQILEMNENNENIITTVIPTNPIDENDKINSKSINNDGNDNGGGGSAGTGGGGGSGDNSSPLTNVILPTITTTDTTTSITISPPPKNHLSLLEEDIKNNQNLHHKQQQLQQLQQLKQQHLQQQQKLKLEQQQKQQEQEQEDEQPTKSPVSTSSTLSPQLESTNFEMTNDDTSLNAPNAMLTPNNVSGISYSIIYPGKKKRIDFSRIFVSPGHSFRFPEEYDKALEKHLNEGNPKEHFKNLDFEARGGFGSVFCAKNKNPHSAYDKQMVALKKMPIKTLRHKRMNLSEIGFLKYFNHPNIVKYLCAYQKSNDELWMVMEFLSGGTLKNAASNFKFCERKIAYVCREILQGLDYLHKQNIAHRDLKSANVMVNDKGEIKLIDFGLCIDFSIEKEEINMLGSPSYISPEMINGNPHSLSTDIWSFGICALEMLLGKLPYHDSRLKAMVFVATNNFNLPLLLSTTTSSLEFRDFLTNCLQFDPSKRLTSSQLLQHPFLTKACLIKDFKEILPALYMSNTLSNMF